MNLQELQQVQLECRVRYLSSLFYEARQRFLDAAHLLEIKSPAIDAVRTSTHGTIYLSPLIPLYDELAARYNQQFFTAQLDWVEPDKSRQDMRWSAYFHHKLIDRLLAEHHVTRNILRAMNVLPCQNPKDAELALAIHAQEMTLPDTEPLWGAMPPCDASVSMGGERE